MSLQDSYIASEFIESSKKQLCQTVPKTGGPYTANQKQKRREEVYRLHFEIGYSARKISEMMKVHRNTINTDVQFWYETLGSSFEKNEIKGCIIKQLTRYETQISRLTEKIESCNDIGLQLNIERIIAEINNKVSSLYLKILQNHAEEETITEETASQISRKLSAQHIITPIKESELLRYIIKLQRCTIQQANAIIENLNEFGLSQFLQSGYHDFKEFCVMRGYLNQKETVYLDDLLIQYVSLHSKIEKNKDRSVAKI